MHASKNQTLDYWGTDKKRLHIVAPILKDLTHTCDAACIKEKVGEQLLIDDDDVNQWLGLQVRLMSPLV